MNSSQNQMCIYKGTCMCHIFEKQSCIKTLLPQPPTWNFEKVVWDRPFSLQHCGAKLWIPTVFIINCSTSAGCSCQPLQCPYSVSLAANFVAKPQAPKFFFNCQFYIYQHSCRPYVPTRGPYWDSTNGNLAYAFPRKSQIHETSPENDILASRRIKCDPV